VSVLITQTQFLPEHALAEFRETMNGAGAIVSFTGVVRGEDKCVKSLSLSHYPGMTEKEILSRGKLVESRFDLMGWRVIHRVGEMHPNEAIVFVAAAAIHRRSAFEAVDYLMDYLKSEAPFWKQEMRGEILSWIEPRQQDKHDSARW